MNNEERRELLEQCEGDVGLAEALEVTIDRSNKPAFKKLSTIEKCRWIKENHSARTIDGVLVDATTANAIMTVYDALNDQNKEKMASLSITKMAKVAWHFVE